VDRRGAGSPGLQSLRHPASGLLHQPVDTAAIRSPRDASQQAARPRRPPANVPSSRIRLPPVLGLLQPGQRRRLNSADLPARERRLAPSLPFVARTVARAGRRNRERRQHRRHRSPLVHRHRLPGFQFHPGPRRVWRSYHGSIDVREARRWRTCNKAAIFMATFVYHTAMLDDKLSRLPLEKKRRGTLTGRRAQLRTGGSGVSRRGFPSGCGLKLSGVVRPAKARACRSTATFSLPAACPHAADRARHQQVRDAPFLHSFRVFSLVLSKPLWL